MCISRGWCTHFATKFFPLYGHHFGLNFLSSVLLHYTVSHIWVLIALNFAVLQEAYRVAPLFDVDNDSPYIAPLPYRVPLKMHHLAKCIMFNMPSTCSVVLLSINFNWCWWCWCWCCILFSVAVEAIVCCYRNHCVCVFVCLVITRTAWSPSACD